MSWLVGPWRRRDNTRDGTINPIPAHHIAMALLGTVILACGWLALILEALWGCQEGAQSSWNRRSRHHRTGVVGWVRRLSPRVRLEDRSTGSARCFLFDFRDGTAYVAVRMTRKIVIKHTSPTPNPEVSLALGDKRIAAASTVRRGEGPKSPDLRLPMGIPTPSKSSGFCDRPDVIGRGDATSPQRTPSHRPKNLPGQLPLRPINARMAS
jgi:hypothetical protein